MNGINRRSLFGWLGAMPFAASASAAPKLHSGGFVTPRDIQAGEIRAAHLRADAVKIRDRSFGDGMSLRVIQQHGAGFVTVERIKRFETAGRTHVQVKLFHLRGSADDDFRLNDAGALIHNGEIVIL